MTFDERYAEYLGMIEPALAGYFGRKEGLPFDGLLESMDYSLTAGGKRLRPTLVLEFCRICGGDVEAALPVACAVEMLHTYSLIHDDLPCMDNDDLRRGKPTNHKVYGECTAVLAGDALQAEAFGTILRCSLPAERRAECAEYLAGAAGVDGICGGQFMDMRADPPQDEAWLTDLQGRKTGCLLSAACAMGAAAAGAGEDKTDLALQYGAALGGKHLVLEQDRQIAHRRFAAPRPSSASPSAPTRRRARSRSCPSTARKSAPRWSRASRSAPWSWPESSARTSWRSWPRASHTEEVDIDYARCMNIQLTARSLLKIRAVFVTLL